MHKVHHHEAVREEISLDLEIVACQGAMKMLAQALVAEFDAYLKAAEAERDKHIGHALVIRDG